MKPFRPFNLGFTLIELLVVISIISILIAILLPALQSARRVAISTKCLSNIRQLGIPSRMYANDFNEWIPGNAMEGSPAVHVYWNNRLTRGDFYTSAPVDVNDTRSIFLCPAATARAMKWDYGMNRHISENAAGSGAKWRRFDGEIAVPSKVALFLERYNDPGAVYANTIRAYSWPYDWSMLSGRHGARGFSDFGDHSTHANGATAQTGFVDLHAQTQQYRDAPGSIPYHRGSSTAKNPWWYTTWVHDNKYY